MIQIRIDRRDFALLCEIYIYREIEKGLFEFFNFDATGRTIVSRKKIQDGIYEEGEVKPSMILPEPECRMILNAFIVAAKEEGIKDQSQSFFEGKLESMTLHLDDKGKLESMTLHLDDMRTLLKLKEPNQ